ncbi:MAG: GNAT family N-acetyltransferase [Candidatus Thorarchaeota archaeon]
MEEPLIIRQPLSKEDFDLMYDLRWRVLRKLWNQPRGSEKDDIENESHPFIVTLNNKIVATARFHKNSEKEGQIRYLAVEKEYRNKRIASKLIRYIEGFAISLGIHNIKLNARKTAKVFFEKLGYIIIGEGPLLFNEIEHFIMHKKLE